MTEYEGKLHFRIETPSLCKAHDLLNGVLHETLKGEKQDKIYIEFHLFHPAIPLSPRSVMYYI